MRNGELKRRETRGPLTPVRLSSPTSGPCFSPRVRQKLRSQQRLTLAHSRVFSTHIAEIITCWAEKSIAFTEETLP
jgi:hypothetical protein